MTWKDKLEIGLKEDAPYRKDNLPESQIRGPEIPTGPLIPQIPMARGDKNYVQPTVPSDDEQEPDDEQSPTPCLSAAAIECAAPIESY